MGLRELLRGALEGASQGLVRGALRDTLRDTIRGGGASESGAPGLTGAPGRRMPTLLAPGFQE
jgi:hypothetical protein